MSQEYDICFLSILYPENIPEYDELTKRHRSQNITAIQKSLIEGIAHANSNNPWIINTLLVPLFSKGYTSPFVKERPLSIGGIEGINYSFLNMPGIYSSNLFPSAKKHLRKWALKDSKKDKVLIAYSLTSYTLRAMRYAKFLNPSIRTIIIVPDLPQYTYQNTNNPLKKIKNILGCRKVVNDIHKYSEKVDGWILFSKHMQEKLSNCKNSMVLESVASDLFRDIEGRRLFDKNIFEIIYAGGCNKEYGLPLLLDAFLLTPIENMRLIIYGKGNYEKEIKEFAKKDSRILFPGEISRKDLLRIQKAADLLINPRVNNGIFTRYSFPSKNMEYLSSGTPMVGFKLDGIPDEYDSLINYFNDPTAESLTTCIMNVYENYNSAKEKALNAQQYVCENKSNHMWSKKILQFIESL